MASKRNPCGVLFPSHNFKKQGRKHEGYQNYVCRRCGRLKRKKVTSWGCVLFGAHQYSRRIKGRKHAPKDVKCKLCGKVKPLQGRQTQ